MDRKRDRLHIFIQCLWGCGKLGQSYSRKNDIEIPEVQKIIQDLKLQICLSDWYIMRDADYPDSGEINLKKICEKSLVAYIYFCDTTYREEDCIRIKCIFYDQERKANEKFSLDIIYARHGLMSALLYSEEVEDYKNTYQYLGKSILRMTNEEVSKFDGIPQNTAGEEIVIGELEKKLKRLCLECFNKGTSEVYVEDFLSGDQLVFFDIINRKEKSRIYGCARVSYDLSNKYYVDIYHEYETIYCGEYTNKEEKRTCRKIWKFK